MKTMQAEPVADGQQSMTSVDVVCKVLCVYQDKASSTRTETSAERMLGNSLLLNRKVPLPSSIKWMN
jgi:hypothetical protein